MGIGKPSCAELSQQNRQHTTHLIGEGKGALCSRSLNAAGSYRALYNSFQLPERTPRYCPVSSVVRLGGATVALSDIRWNRERRSQKLITEYTSTSRSDFVCQRGALN